MSGEDEDSSEKPHEASQRKIDEARRKGDVAKSTDLITAAGWAGLLLAGVAFGPGALSEASSILAGLFQLAAAPSVLSAGFIGAALGQAAIALFPLAILPFAGALLSVIAQQAAVVAPDKLVPKISRISVISNAKNKFGRSGLFEFAKSTAKLILFSIVLLGFLWSRRDDMLGALFYEPAGVSGVLLRLCRDFFAVSVIAAAAIGGVDLAWQRAEHARKLRMSRKEVTDEQKDSEGDPHTKQKRRQKAESIATNRMMNDVPDAAVVIANPTHFAVALKWDRSAKGAPICVAKGVDEVALRIRQIAEENGVPVKEDPPVARALHASVDVGAEIAPDQYAPVAVAIRFAEDMRRKAKKR